MPWYCYLAFKQLFPTGKKFPFFAIMSIIGVMLGVAVLLVVQTVMNGFSEKIQEVFRNTQGEVRITSSQIIYNWEELLKKIQEKPYVTGVAPNAQGVVMLQHKDRPAFPGVRGIDVNLEPSVVPIKDYLLQGQLDDLDDETIILGSGLAQYIGASMGSKIEVYTPLMLERAKEDELLLPRELEVVGIYESNYAKIDNNTILVTTRLMQDLYNLGNGIHGMSLKLKKGVDIKKATEDLNNTIASSYIKATSWLDDENDMLFVLKLEKMMMFFIILFVILVASFSIASSLMTTVVRKTREIGLLGALGARPFHIAWLFTLQGLWIGFIGTILGLIFGVLAIEYRNPIVHFLGKIFGHEDFFELNYLLSEVPAHYLMSDFVMISVCSLLIAMFAGFIPAIRAARLKPSEALRSE